MPEQLKPKCYIFDLDGTINNNDGHFYHKGDFAEWDSPNIAVITLLQSLAPDILKIVVSGRIEKYRSETMKWLQDYNIEIAKLILKPDYSPQPGFDFKFGAIKALSEHYEILGIFEDQLKHARKFRELGLMCFDVAGHEFSTWQPHFLAKLLNQLLSL